MTLDRIDEVLGDEFPALTVWKRRIVDEVDARLDANRVDEPVFGDLGPFGRQVGLQLVRPREILVGEQRVVRVQHDEVRVDVRGLHRVQAGRRLVHRVPVDLHAGERRIGRRGLFLPATAGRHCEYDEGEAEQETAHETGFDEERCG